ncbi:MAG: alpha/beta hydrolase [Chloroflexi bacterium]|nr:alpha/beta hydrolase [Chloroflexota bacterium]
MHGAHFGLASCANVWDRNIGLLARDFHVLAIDKIGLGFTDNPKDDKDYVIGSAVGHAHGFLRALKTGPAHVAGHSRGGFQACRLALEHPESVKTLTIVNSGSMTIRSIPMSIHDIIGREIPRIDDPRERFRHKLADYSYSQEHLTDGFIDILLEIAALPKSKEAAAKMEAGLKRQFREDLAARQKETQEWIKAGRLKAPTLLVWGADDPAAKLEPVGMDVMRLVFAAVPRARMCIINQAGHFSFREQPEAFVAALTGFIKSTPGGLPLPGDYYKSNNKYRIW